MSIRNGKYCSCFSLLLLLGMFQLLLESSGKLTLNATSLSSTKNIQIADLETWKAPRDISSRFPYYLSGYDLESRPVEAGKWAFEEVVSEGGQRLEDLRMHLEQLFFRMDRRAPGYANSGDTYTDGSVVIVNLAKFNLSQLFHAPTTHFILTMFGNFREIQENMAYSFWLNADSVGNAIIHLLKPLMGNFREKMEVYGTNKYRWIPFLLRKINGDQLPPAYGGVNKNFKPVAYFDEYETLWPDIFLDTPAKSLH